MAADFLTKPLVARDFEMCRDVMGLLKKEYKSTGVIDHAPAGKVEEEE